MLRWLFMFLTLSIPALALTGRVKTFSSYQTLRESSQLGVHAKLAHEKYWGQSEFGFKLASITENQEEFFSSKAYIENLSYSYHASLVNLSIGILDKNFSHIEAISLMNKNESSFFVSPNELARVGSPSAYVKHIFPFGGKFEFLWQIEKSKMRYMSEKSNIWFPDNRITNLNFDDVLLLLPDEPQFQISDNRELEAASLNNISLKIEKNFDSWDIGVYAFRGSSGPSMFYSFTASVTNFDGSIITAEPGIKIIPTYFKEQAFVLYGTKLFANSILKFELGSRKDVSDISYIDLNETAAQMQWETNLSWDDINTLHVFIISSTNSKNDLNYRLAPQNFIYVLNLTSNSPWSHSLKLSKSLKYGSSGILQWASKYAYNDKNTFGYSLTHFKSSDKDLVNMYNEKHFVSAHWEYLF